MIAVHGNKIKVFAGNGSKKLAQSIADKLGLELGLMEVGRFSDGECSVNIGESVRGADVFVIQSTAYPVNDNLIELLVIIDAMRRASAARITAFLDGLPALYSAGRDRVELNRSILSRLLFDTKQTLKPFTINDNKKFAVKSDGISAP